MNRFAGLSCSLSDRAWLGNGANCHELAMEQDTTPRGASAEPFQFDRAHMARSAYEVSCRARA